MSGISLTTLDTSVINFDQAGIFTPITAISVVDSSAQELTLTAGKKGILFVSIGPDICWYADSTVLPGSNIGAPLVPYQTVFIRNAASDFSVFFRSDTGLTATIVGVEY